jgi:glycosyltransferase domain-containing protein
MDINNSKIDYINNGTDITIIIITYNRYSFLLRLLRFYLKYEYGFNILILDSSSDELNNQELLYILKADNIVYKKYLPSIFFTNKIADGSKYINTSFSVLCSDDDFLIPQGVIKSKEFLEKNPCYSSAQGLYFLHANADSGSIFKSKFEPMYECSHSAEQLDPFERVNAYLVGSACLPFYAVHRTDLFTTIWSETSNYVSDWGLSELFPCALSFIYGKMKVLPVFYMSREPNDSIWYDESRHLDMYNTEKMSKAINGLAIHLSNITGMVLFETEILIREAFSVYLNPHVNNNNVTLNNILQSIKNKIRIRTRVRSLIGIVKSHTSIKTQLNDDFEKVNQSVISSGLGFQQLNSSRKNYATNGQ